MKKVFLLASLLAIYSTSIAQISFTVNGGMALPSAGNFADVQIEQNGDSKAIIGTMGLGLQGTLGLHYHANEHFALGLNVSYFSGLKAGYYQFVNLPTDLKTDIKFKGTMISVNPEIMVSMGGEGLNPYARFGAIIGVSTKSVVEVTMSGTGAAEGKDVQEFTGGIPLGVSAGLGVSYPLNESLSLYGELALRTINSKPKKVSNTETFTGGTTNPDVDFVDVVKANDPPTNQPKTTIGYSSLGLNIGLRFMLGK